MPVSEKISNTISLFLVIIGSFSNLLLKLDLSHRNHHQENEKGMVSTIVSCPLAMEWYLVPKHTSHEEYEIDGFTDDPETLTEKNNPLLPR